jgi:3,4-dihydroxy 2-butanone 4-phosphate synthase/GTP cyclohydrolase II
MLDKISEAIEEIKFGRMVVVVDDECRENEGDLIMAASKVTADDVNFMATKGRGLICVPIDEKYAGKFRLSPMVEENTERLCTNFTVSVDYRHDTSTGISMPDRAKTIKALSESENVAEDFLRPGHIFPLIARSGRVKERAGHTEAAVKLAELAGFSPVGVLCEIIREDGEMGRLDYLKDFAAKHALKIISIKDLISHISE